MELDARKRKILEAIIMDYISSAEPIGSRTISRKYDFGVSPATIRNEMADLEDMGYLEQPHTSSGRVPSNLGYRYYVDFLMARSIIDQRMQKNIAQHYYYNKLNQLEDIIKETSTLLSKMTNYTALVLAPQIEDNSFQHIQLLLIESGKALVVVVTDSGRIENKMLDIPDSIDKTDLELISKVLNDHLKGLAVKDWNKKIMSDVNSQLKKEHQLASLVMEILDGILTGESGDDKVYLGGALNILNQPEFMNVKKAKNLFEILEKEEFLAELMKENKSGINVKIGNENKFEGFKDCSIITATYAFNGKVVGTIGVLGPTRMQYSQAVSAVEFLTHLLSDTLNKI